MDATFKETDQGRRTRMAAVEMKLRLARERQGLDHTLEPDARRRTIEILRVDPWGLPTLRAGADMTMRNCMTVVAVAVLACVSGIQADDFGTGGNQFTLDFVPISGNPGVTCSINTSGDPVETFTAGVFGDYTDPGNDYRMGKHEITNDQWNKFMAAYGIVTGDPSYAYDEDPYFTGTNVPTNNVSWHEAAQFVNWLNTSTGHQAAYKFTGTQGTGDYTLGTWSPAEADNGTNLYRHKDAMYYMPTEDEWVKAGYWNGTTLQTYANASPGDLVSGEPDPAKWNYYPSAGNEPWDVGSGSEELNGTFDMMGNFLELMEGPDHDPGFRVGSNRGVRGGSYAGTDILLPSSNRFHLDPYYEHSMFGFRIASEVPEPSSLALLSLGGFALIRRRR